MPDPRPIHAAHRSAHRRPFSMMRAFLDTQASGGLMLMMTALTALLLANSPLAPVYFGVLGTYLGPLKVGHWINDGLMAVFFLVVGLEIKREVLDGQLSTWSRRVLPGVAALGGMAVPALVFLAFNAADPVAARGWAIPSATDIAFALGVLSLLGSRVPTSLKVFLTALAITDDLGAVLIIALFYSSDLSVLHLAGAAAVVLALITLNRNRITVLWPYLFLGPILWWLVFGSGVHATIAGVLLALTIPLHHTPGKPDAAHSPLHRLEHALHPWSTFLVIPIFGFANAGVSFAGLGLDALTSNLTLGVAAGLVFGKVVGVFGSSMLVIRLGLADVPMGAGRMQLLGVALLCGIGFTMSLFIGLLAFAPSPLLQEEVKIGILLGSLVAGLLGYGVLRVAPREVPAPKVQKS